MADPHVALVTGGSSGIGAAVCRALAAEEMTVVVCSSRSVQRGEALAAELGGSYVQGDVADDGDARRIVATAVERHGRLDVVVNSAGTTATVPHADLEAVTDELWTRILGVNLLGPWHVIRAAVPHLRATGDGVVVNVSSRAGSRPVGSSIPYAVSKAGLNHLTALLANALGPEIRVNAVAPGLVETPWAGTAGLDDLRRQVEARAPLRRVGQADEIAEAVLGLVRSRYTTGVVLMADGGMFLR
ncbi:MAG TPA: SDR family oxidoreductase [Acidimicrobiales bacterium]|nr:SDR family oxidoreductase [Acidimicrobiales bacterium]